MYVRLGGLALERFCSPQVWFRKKPFTMFRVGDRIILFCDIIEGILYFHILLLSASKQLGSREKKPMREGSGRGESVVPKGTCPLTCFLQPGSTPDNTFSRELIHGSIHRKDQCPQSMPSPGPISEVCCTDSQVLMSSEDTSYLNHKRLIDKFQIIC